ncbi:MULTISPECIES: acyl-CoA dehydrogenase family protein [unclassified Streptomyces]|uniref:acyl-CoA dehydrogenase family protein n=1 Tax=unclassified Streptomyces TaxID=2593676 RepID=UPI0022B6AFA6|nr:MULTISPECIES: acyl-CoA dehydrogenase family protein [unclassified Streptomyces]MCZ7415694.1 acyl-CoA dehydrogenase family protein [Streptomyces sp. WMMC897]MCZ7434495.1 acyl-CoA dehydrogenase family protein [Streptomyces sp. WMMC1477]
MTATAPPGCPPPLTVLPGPAAEWRQTVRDVARTAVAPRVRAMDEAERLDDDLVKELFRAGLMGIEVPRAYGGAGGDLFQVVLAIEELARVDPAVAVFVDVQNALVASALLRHGSGDQKRRFLPRLATGLVGAYAISEEGAGSDAFALATRAEPDGDGYRLTGRKQWITSAAQAGLFLVFARTGGDTRAPSLGAFLVERDAPGLTVGDPAGKMGIRASSTCEVVLDGVRVGRQDLVGRPDGGAALMVETLVVGKLGIAAQLVGLADGALRYAFDYAGVRRQFGTRVIDFQGVGFPLAGLAAELEAARALLYDTARLLQHGAPQNERIRATSMAKYVASRIAERSASQAVETLGGNGFSTRHPVEKLYRDAKVGAIYEGTSNIQFQTIVSLLAGNTARSSGPAAEREE